MESQATPSNELSFSQKKRLQRKKSEQNKASEQIKQNKTSEQSKTNSGPDSKSQNMSQMDPIINEVMKMEMKFTKELIEKAMLTMWDLHLPYGSADEIIKFIKKGEETVRHSINFSKALTTLILRHLFLRI